MFIHKKPRYTIVDLMAMLSIGRNRIYEAINTGKLKTHKVGKRRFALPQYVDDYIELCRREGDSENAAV